MRGGGAGTGMIVEGLIATCLPDAVREVCGPRFFEEGRLVADCWEAEDGRNWSIDLGHYLSCPKDASSERRHQSSDGSPPMRRLSEAAAGGQAKGRQRWSFQDKAVAAGRSTSEKHQETPRAPSSRAAAVNEFFRTKN